MKVNCFWEILLLGIAVSGCGGRTMKMPADYVNPFVGASTTLGIGPNGVSHESGKTFPGATTPWGMVQVSPNTVSGGDNGPGYSYEHKTVEGFAFTQMSGIGWFGDLGNFLVMPTVGKMYTVAGKENGSVKGWRSAFDKETETAGAGYYSAFLTDYGIKVEATAAPHSGMLRFTFPESDSSRVQIDLARRVGGTAEKEWIEVVDDRTIRGWMHCTPECGGWGNGSGHADYTVYFYARLSRPMEKYGFWSADIPSDWKRKNGEVNSVWYQEQVARASILTGIDSLSGKHIGFFAEYPTKKDEQICLQAGISFVDLDGAKANFDAEMSGRSFEKIRDDAKALWNDAFDKIEIETDDEEAKAVFYTALYHTMIDPRIFSDVDGRYVGGDGLVKTSSGKFAKRTIFSGWDVFRSQMPLLSLLYPDVVNDLINSLVTLAEESGNEYLSKWEIVNAYSGCMLGNPAICVIADAYSKGIRSYDVEKAYRYCVNTSARSTDPALGYAPEDISRTLEYAYGDWCLAQLAGMTGHAEDSVFFAGKSQFYKNTFDPEKGWFRPRKEDGTWEEWPERGIMEPSYGCVECNPFQQGWFVPHDVDGLVGLLGGRDSTLAKLDRFFKDTPEDFHWNEYYNHSNEPVHWVPFLYNRLGVPYKTQYWTKKVCTNAYFNDVFGLCGNEDCGQMSAWYVLSAIGIHPANPADGTYEVTSPVFDRAVISLDPKYSSGRKFTIIAHDNCAENLYIKRAELNGKVLDKMQITYDDIQSGSKLELWMSPEPADGML